MLACSIFLRNYSKILKLRFFHLSQEKGQKHICRRQFDQTNGLLGLNKPLHSCANILISYIIFERLNTTENILMYNGYRINSYTVKKEMSSSSIRHINKETNTIEPYILDTHIFKRWHKAVQLNMYLLVDTISVTSCTSMKHKILNYHQ